MDESEKKGQSPQRHHEDVSGFTEKQQSESSVHDAKIAVFSLLAEEQNIYRSLYTYSTDAVFLLDAEGNIMDINPSGEKMSGYNREELRYSDFNRFLLPADVPKSKDSFQAVFSEKRTETLEFSFRSKTGGLVTVNATIVPILKNGEVVALLGISRDITEQEQSVRILDAQNKVLEMIAKSTPLEETLDNLLRMAEYQTGAKCSIHRYDKKSRTLSNLAAPSLPDDYMQAIEGMKIGELGGSCGASVSRKEIVIVEDIGRSELWEQYRDIALRNGLRAGWSLPLIDGEGEILGTFAMYYEVKRLPTEKEMELIRKTGYLARLAIEQDRSASLIYRMAYHDSLTGLPNRRSFQEKLSRSIAEALRSGDKLSILYVDLDRFKTVNDSLGHGAGDALLAQIAARLKSSLDGEAFIARHGGDEFAILTEDWRASEAGATAQRILDAFAEPFEVGGYELFVTPSVGISIYPEHGNNAAALLQHADAAMYKAKEAGKDTYAVYEAEDEMKIGARILLENDLRKSLEKNELHLFYQPQISLFPEQRIGAEALLRWHRGNSEWVSPVDFIPLAEETGLIIPIGEWVLRTACRQGKRWIDEGYEPFIMAINLSPRQFRQRNLVELIRTILDDTGYPPEFLELEITEGLTLDVESASEKMKQLRDLGVHISIDDFGTGYSSLNYLKRLPISRLKVDRSFVRDIETDLGDRDIVKAIISMAHNLKITVIAEGVENEEQLSFLKENGCDEVQGYLFGRPVPADEFRQGMDVQNAPKQ
ncbi:sensor domain-containing protein [Saccharibacillus endophyticus]|uniref:Bifunctional diguanylate cyclase/phosphodiesterase n=1 Tax=Saccharibacillus endophyticus TaxID=2060666 RepID=A0ABQ1ZQX5_9BACL|nr:EAL domain-containing protein [Saccharibacillus endophyticus]GGH75946.1 bifunctional diguanylate cyclase/phosphodiesterase [Saccharibacillus endophyticus]